MDPEIGFETIFEGLFQSAYQMNQDNNEKITELYCPDCYDCDFNCEECDVERD